MAKWNWQQNDWPHFTYEAKPLELLEEQLFSGSGLLLGFVKHLSRDDENTLKVDIISREALKTSEIEGEHLDRESVQSSIQQHFGLKTTSKKIPPAERGMAEMMVDLFKDFPDPLTHSLLYKWHEMIMGGRTDLRSKGAYRKGPDPMQVTTRSLYNPKIYFVAPPFAQVHLEMKRFKEWFNNSSPKGREALPPLIRAGIAHHYFISIHPFEDGNGRIGRAIVEKALAQCLGQPSLIALSTFIEENKKDYYSAIDRNNKKNDIMSWLIYFGNAVLGAQKYSQQWVEFLIMKTRLFDRLKNQLNTRQKKVLLRIFEEGPKGFEGGLSAGNYTSITKSPTAITTTRDLSDLVRKGALIRKGERRYARYFLNLEEME